jgi:hypothetical protein
MNFNRRTDSMNKVATLTLNPAVDISTTLDHLTANHKLRCEARCMSRVEAVSILPSQWPKSAAPPPPSFLRRPFRRHPEKGAAKKNIEHHAVETNEWTRMNLAVREEASGDHTASSCRARNCSAVKLTPV